MTENTPPRERKRTERRRPARGGGGALIDQVSPLPPGIDPDAIGNAQIDDAYLASEEFGARRRATEIEQEERRAKVIALRRTGAPFRAIAEQLGISVGLAYSDYRKALERLVPVEDLEAARQMELDRLDRIQMAHWGDATDPNSADRFDATRAVLATMDRRAKLLGLDRITERTAADPAGVNNVETVDQAIVELVEEMRRREQWVTG